MNFIYRKTEKTLTKKRKFRIPLSWRIYKFLRSHSKTDFAIVEGNKMYLDSKDSLNLSIQKFEPIETELIKKIVKDGDVVLDIGANIGYYTLLLAKIVGNQGMVFAYEPEPNNFQILKKNVNINKFSNINLHNVAISNENGKIKLYLAETNKGMHRIYPSKLCSNEFVEVNMIKLDDDPIFQKISETISFIKIDVEGFELQVLKGMKKMLSKNTKVKILLEFIPASMIEAKQDPKKLLDFLKENGFTLKFINNENKSIEQIKNNSDFINKFSNSLHQNAEGTNLFCIKES